MSLTSARVGFRLARREIRRHPWRNALVLLMVVIPTMGMTIAATALRTDEWTNEERRAAEAGQAEIIGEVRPNADGAEAEGRLRAALPAGSYLIEHTTSDRIRLEHDRAYVNVSDLDLADPIVDGRFTEVDGRLPDGPDEAVVTGAVLDELDLAVGDHFTPQVLDRELTIVGSVDRIEYDDSSVFVSGEIPTGPATFAQASVDLDQLPSSFEPVRDWAFHRVADDAWYLGTETRTGVFWTYLGGAVALLVVGTVIAAAFAVGARRQLHTIGLLSSAGASPRAVRWYLLAQGVIGGGLGSLLGIGLAVLLTRMVPEDWIEAFLDRPVDGPVTRLADVLPIVVIGTAAAVGAAWIPARSAARVPTLQALAGRRPQALVPRRLPILGVFAVGGGSLLLALAVAASRRLAGDPTIVLVAVAGSVAVLVGTLAIGPWVVGGLERLSTRWPESGRLAGRSLARSRLRSAAVVGALCAVSATLIAGTSVFQTQQDRQEASDGADYLQHSQAVIDPNTVSGQPSPTTSIDTLVNGAVAAVPGADPIEIPDAVPHPSRTVNGPVGATLVTADQGELAIAANENSVAIATPAWMDLLGVPDDLRAELDNGAAVVVGDEIDDQVSGVSVFASSSIDADQTTIPFGGIFESPRRASSLPQVLISQATADDLGLTVPDDPRVLLQFDHDLTERQREVLTLLADDLNWSPNGTNQVYVDLVLPGSKPPLTPVEIRMLGYGAIFLLVGSVVAIGLALAAKDNEDENQVLSAVGAPPRTIRRVAALRGGLLVASATVIAVPTGLLAAWAIVSAADNADYVTAAGVVRSLNFALHPDWITLGFVAVVLPLGVMGVALFAGWVRDLARRPRPLVFAFAD